MVSHKEIVMISVSVDPIITAVLHVSGVTKQLFQSSLASSLTHSRLKEVVSVIFLPCFFPNAINYAQGQFYLTSVSSVLAVICCVS
jgi:hypothetical protein